MLPTPYTAKFCCLQTLWEKYNMPFSICQVDLTGIAPVSAASSLVAFTMIAGSSILNTLQEPASPRVSSHPYSFGRLDGCIGPSYT